MPSSAFFFCKKSIRQTHIYRLASDFRLFFLGNVVRGGYWSKIATRGTLWGRNILCKQPARITSSSFATHLNFYHPSLCSQCALPNVNADQSVSSSVLWLLWKDDVLLRLWQNWAFQEHHAHRRSSLVLGQMCSSALAVTRSASSVLRRENSRQVTLTHIHRSGILVTLVSW